MKVIGFNGSPRKDGNTATLMGYLLREIEKEGIKTELVQLSGKAIHGCIACYRCFENQDKRCAVRKDAANEYIKKIISAQGTGRVLSDWQTGRCTRIKSERPCPVSAVPEGCIPSKP
ncbi:MAG: flavodoxin family protein [Smithella sp.]